MGMMVTGSLNKMWKQHNIGLKTKIRLWKSLPWSVAAYGSEAWTLKKEEERRIETFEMKGLRRILRIPWTALKTNESILNDNEITKSSYPS